MRLKHSIPAAHRETPPKQSSSSANSHKSNNGRPSSTGFADDRFRFEAAAAPGIRPSSSLQHYSTVLVVELLLTVLFSSTDDDNTPARLRRTTGDSAQLSSAQSAIPLLVITKLKQNNATSQRRRQIVINQPIKLNKQHWPSTAFIHLTEGPWSIFDLLENINLVDLDNMSKTSSSWEFKTFES